MRGGNGRNKEDRRSHHKGPKAVRYLPISEPRRTKCSRDNNINNNRNHKTTNNKPCPSVADTPKRVLDQ